MINSKGFSIVAVLVVVLIFIAGAGAYWYTQKSSYSPSIQATSDSNAIHAVATTKTSAAKDMAGWKIYTDSKYGVSFKYPSAWFIHTSSDSDTIYFSKSVDVQQSQYFAAFSVTSLMLGKIDSTYSVTPQEYFDTYYKDDSRAALGGTPKSAALQLGKVPAVHHVVEADDRYIMYMSKSEIDFILYRGDNQNPTEYTSGDDATVEQIIGTMTLSNKSFVKVNI